MSGILICFFLALNGFISYWNARSCGEVWVEARSFGGFNKLLVWSAAIQSAIGFSMIIIFFECLFAGAMGYQGIARYALSLWYLAIIVPAIGTGLIITVYSWRQAYERQDFSSVGLAVYNTIASGHNIYEASSGIGDAFKTIGDLFDDDDGWVAGVVILIVIAALGGGIFMTYSLIRKYAGTLSLPQTN